MKMLPVVDPTGIPLAFKKGSLPFDDWVLVDILTYHIRNVQRLTALKINRITEYIL